MTLTEERIDPGSPGPMELPTVVNQLRAGLRLLVKSTAPAQRMAQLETLSRQVQLLTAGAASLHLDLVERAVAALEAFLKELRENSQHVNASALRTLTQAVDALALLAEAPDKRGRLETDEALEIMVVDDDAICRLAIGRTLTRAGFKVTPFADPLKAQEYAQANPLALVVLDVQMPGVNGFDLCARLRASSANGRTPVLFVTSQNDFESRSKSILSGGGELISKPFLFSELAVKTLTHLLRSRLADAAPPKAVRAEAECHRVQSAVANGVAGPGCVDAVALSSGEVRGVESQDTGAQLAAEANRRLAAERLAKDFADAAHDAENRARESGEKELAAQREAERLRERVRDLEAASVSPGGPIPVAFPQDFQSWDERFARIEATLQSAAQELQAQTAACRRVEELMAQAANALLGLARFVGNEADRRDPSAGEAEPLPPCSPPSFLPQTAQTVALVSSRGLAEAGRILHLPSLCKA
jgi:DNA-binding response OmpR family regulator